MPAIKSGLIKRDPFLEIKYKRQQYFVEYLTQEEINKIAEVDLVSPDLDRVRDIFHFACYTGHILQPNLRKTAVSGICFSLSVGTFPILFLFHTIVRPFRFCRLLRLLGVMLVLV